MEDVKSVYQEYKVQAAVRIFCSSVRVCITHMLLLETKKRKVQIGQTGKFHTCFVIMAATEENKNYCMLCIGHT